MAERKFEDYVPYDLTELPSETRILDLMYAMDLVWLGSDFELPDSRDKCLELALEYADRELIMYTVLLFETMREGNEESVFDEEDIYQNMSQLSLTIEQARAGDVTSLKSFLNESLETWTDLSKADSDPEAIIAGNVAHIVARL